MTVDRTIILNTGRCGSSLLSKLIAAEPETASISESIDAATVMQTGVLTGEQIWSALSAPSPQLTALSRMGMVPAEHRYPGIEGWAGDLGRLPAVLSATLPSVSHDPDHLFEQLAERVPAFPARPAAAQYGAYLDLLAALTGKRRWVERTGGSCAHAGSATQAFPDAKLVYLTRDVAATAQSMCRHPVFQFAALRMAFEARCGIDPYRTAPGDPNRYPADLRSLLPDTITAEAFTAQARSARWFEGLCRRMHDRTEVALASWPAERVLRMRYEDLLDDPVAVLTGLGAFIGFADPAGWALDVSSQVWRSDA